jgi:hypothetical protein
VSAARHSATHHWGGWNVLAMLIVLLAQAVLGLFTVDLDGLESGPLSDLVSFETGRYLAAWHSRMLNVLIALIILHVSAIPPLWPLQARQPPGADGERCRAPAVGGSDPLPGRYSDAPSSASSALSCLSLRSSPGCASDASKGTWNSGHYGQNAGFAGN